MEEGDQGKKPELEALWNAVGPTLISSAEKITGAAKFPEGRQTVRLTLRHAVPSPFAGIRCQHALCPA